MYVCMYVNITKPTRKLQINVEEKKHFYMNLHDIIYKEIHLSQCICPSSTCLAIFLNVILTYDPTITSAHLQCVITNEKHSFLRSANSLQLPQKEKYPHHLPQTLEKGLVMHTYMHTYRSKTT